MKTKKRYAIRAIQRHFPQVTKIVEARRSVQIEVTQADIDSGAKKDPEHCAVANACKRMNLCDGAMIGIGTTYLVKGNRAIRFMTNPTVAREIVAFDRDAAFEPGKTYRLSKVSPARRLGRLKPTGPKVSKRKAPQMLIHRSSNIRVLHIAEVAGTIRRLAITTNG